MVWSHVVLWFCLTGALSADLKERVSSSPNTVVKSIADVLLQSSWASKEMPSQVAVFARRDTSVANEEVTRCS